jgi:hypothetical protein
VLVQTPVETDTVAPICAVPESVGDEEFVSGGGVVGVVVVVAVVVVAVVVVAVVEVGVGGVVVVVVVGGGGVQPGCPSRLHGGWPLATCAPSARPRNATTTTTAAA